MFGFHARRLRLARGVWLLAALWIFAAPGCNTRRKEPGKAPALVARSRVKPQLTRRPNPPAPLEQFVQQHVEQADASGMRVLVYVGASWCQPCQRFHKALEAGELDESLAGTKFLEFDADRDRAELRAAGYAAKYIPLFSVPDASGHSTGLSIEGVIKSDSAVRENLVPRLLALLDGKATE